MNDLYVHVLMVDDILIMAIVDFEFRKLSHSRKRQLKENARKRFSNSNTVEFVRVTTPYADQNADIMRYS